MRRNTLLLILALLTTLTFSQVKADGRISWSLEYYPNPYLIAPSSFVEYRDNISLNFGRNAPRDGFPNENYSIRLAADAYFPVGNYRFYVLADDEVNLSFDFNNRLISTIDNPKPGELLVADLYVGAAGVYHLQMDYRQNTDTAYLFFDYENTDDGIRGPNFSALSPSLPPPDANLQPVGDLLWTAQYYATHDLNSTPSAITGQTGLRLNWGWGSPFPSVPVDGFAARWTSSYTFDGSEYVIQVLADDGARVFIDGMQVLNDWNASTGNPVRVAVRPSAGTHTITVEYYEASGVAFIDFQMFRVSNTPAIPNPANASATVTASRLNVRAQPDARNGAVIARISNNETYPIVGRLADNSWVQINIGTAIGWVSGAWVNTTNLQAVPVVGGDASTSVQPQPPKETAFTAFTRTEVNLRPVPTVQSERILIIPQNITVPIVGRTVRGDWWQVNYRGTVGWVSAEFAVIEQENPDLNLIPITTN
jgi:uncharacterized protein YraI